MLIHTSNEVYSYFMVKDSRSELTMEIDSGHEEYLGRNILYLCTIRSGNVKTRKSDRSTGKDFSSPKKFIIIKTMPHCLI